MAINVVAVLYLNQREVRSVFDTGAEDDDSHEHVVAAPVIDAADLELLRRHEPILRFTRGELFLPMPTDGYVAASDLLSGPSIREATVVAPAGSLTLDGLGAVGDPPPSHLQFLRFVSRPMNAVEPPAGGTGRIVPCSGPGPARAGRAASPARRRRSRHVPPAAGASRAGRPRPPRRYATIRGAIRGSPTTHRVVRTAGWVVLHYLFFTR
jgi:hypothetical protein